MNNLDVHGLTLSQAQEIINKAIKLAYEKCADSTTKVIFGYMDKILIDWHKNGVKTKEDVAALEQKPVNTKPNEKMAVYDLDLYNDKLNQLPD